MKKSIGLVIILGSFLWSLTMFKSGLKYSFGYGYWGPNGHDGIWHIALSQNLSKLNFSNPVFAGESIKNYHLGFDLVLGILSRTLHIPTNYLYFQILPIVFALSIGLLVYKFVFKWTQSTKASLLSVIFTYFGGSMAWILGKGESTFWSQQAISTLVNPPFALSLILILLGIISLQNKKLLLSILFFGILIQIKAYAAILVLGSLFIVSIYDFFFLKSKFLSKVFWGALVLNLLLSTLVTNDSLSVFSWQPFWFLETMMSYSDRLDWQRFYSAMTTYKMGGITLKWIISYILAFGIFIIGNFWTRIIFVKDMLKKVDSLKIFLIIIISAGIIIPLFLVQKGTPWNTIQFMYYSLFFTGILSGISSAKVNNWLLALIILLTIPTTLITLKDVYIPSRPPSMLSNLEIEALNFLKDQPHGVVLTYPYDQDKAKAAINNPPRPLYLYESTAYVSAYSKKEVFLEDEVNLNITGYDWKSRRYKVLSWLNEKDEIKARQFLIENNITYVYWIKKLPDNSMQRALLGEGQLGLTQIFENSQVVIFQRSN